MKNFTKKIQERIKFLGLTQQKLADKIGMSVSHVNHIISGKRVPPVDVILVLEKTLELPSGFLIYDNLVNSGAALKVPLLENKFIDIWLAGDKLSSEVKFFTVHLDMETKMSNKVFLANITGDSMVSMTDPSRSLNHKDQVLIDPEHEIKNSAIVAVVIDNDLKFRKVVFDGTTPYLESLDKNLPTLKFDSSIKYKGTVVQKITKMI